MPNAVYIAQYDLSPAALIEALTSDAESATKSMLVERLRKQQKTARAAFKQQRDNYDKLYEEIAQGDADAAYLVQMAEVVHEKERTAAERLRPEMERLKERLAGKGQKLEPEIREHFQKSLDIAVAWLELYKTLRNRLLVLSSNREPGFEAPLRAHPVAGDIDYAELSREHIARYPKIRAALAK